MFKVIEHILSSALVAGGSVSSIGYPEGTSEATFLFGVNHKMRAGNTSLEAPTDFTVTLADSSFSITLGSGESTIPAGTKLLIQLDAGGKVFGDQPADLLRAEMGQVVFLDLGTPIAADVDGIIEAYTGDGGALTLDGDLVSGGVATLDVPRNLVADSGGADTAVLTITGTDEYGETIVETITLNGTTAVAGKKAFKTVTAVSASAAIANGAFLGTGDVLGLPIGLPKTGCVIKELENGATATAGTLVAAVQSKATATTGDVRGTYDPNSAADGQKAFGLIVAVKDPEWKGVPQYGG